MSVQKWIREVVSMVEEAGARVTNLEHRRKHLAVFCRYGNNKFVLFTSKTPSDVRTLQNLRTNLRDLIRRTHESHTESK